MILTELTNEFCYVWILCQEIAREITHVKIFVYNNDTFLFGHYMWVMGEVNIFSLYVYMKFLEIIARILYMTRFSQGQ